MLRTLATTTPGDEKEQEAGCKCAWVGVHMRLKSVRFTVCNYSYKINKTQTKCTPDLNIAQGDQLLITNETEGIRETMRDQLSINALQQKPDIRMQGPARKWDKKMDCMLTLGHMLPIAPCRNTVLLATGEKQVTTATKYQLGWWTGWGRERGA